MELTKWSCRQSGIISVPAFLRNQQTTLPWRVVIRPAGYHVVMEPVPDSERACAELTLREQEVLHWVSQGKRNQEIALILGISSRTIGKHLQHILDKLGVETRTAAALQWQERRGKPEPSSPVRTKGR